jgi:hypothetical protein
MYFGFELSSGFRFSARIGAGSIYRGRFAVPVRSSKRISIVSCRANLFYADLLDI